MAYPKLMEAKDLPEDGLELTFKLLYRLGESCINNRYIDGVATLMDAFSDSRVAVFLVPYDDKSGGFLQLRCGDIRSDTKLTPGCLTSIIELAPFIAACAGPAATPPETTNPERLSQLEERVKRLEDALGLKN